MKKAMGVLAWIAGILISGSEGQIYINFIGLAVFFWGCLVIAEGVWHEQSNPQ